VLATAIKISNCLRENLRDSLLTAVIGDAIVFIE